MERLGEVFVLNGRVMKAADVMRDYKPEPEQRGSGQDRRKFDRRKNRVNGRRNGCRRFRDRLNKATWQTIVAQERHLMNRAIRDTLRQQRQRGV
jgi:hypothetical protein